jgi:hypothetical protein
VEQPQLGYSKKLNWSKNELGYRMELDNVLMEKREHERKKEHFYDEFNSRNYKNVEDSDMSGDSAFLQF